MENGRGKATLPSPATRATSPRSSVGKMPSPGTTKRGLDRLTAEKFEESFPTGRGELEFTGKMMPAGRDQYANVICEVRCGDELFNFPLKYDSKNYELLHSKFGDEPTNWKGEVECEIKSYRKRERDGKTGDTISTEVFYVAVM